MSRDNENLTCRRADIEKVIELVRDSMISLASMDVKMSALEKAARKVSFGQKAGRVSSAEKIRVPLTETTTAILTILTEEEGLGHIDPPFTRPITLSEFALAIRHLSARKYEIEKP